jgi:predicted amino acid-binding ACT domain protein
MKRWFVLSAIGQDRPGLVAELAQLIYDCDANLEDSRMTILGTDFAVILLASSSGAGCADRLAQGAKRLEREHGLTILLRALEGEPRSPVPAPGHVAARVTASGQDRAGIVAQPLGCNFGKPKFKRFCLRRWYRLYKSEKLFGVSYIGFVIFPIIGFNFQLSDFFGQLTAFFF